MLDIQSLERKWLKYKIKRYLPYTIVTLVLMITLLSVASLFYYTKKNIPVATEHTFKVNNTPKLVSPTTSSSYEVILEPLAPNTSPKTIATNTPPMQPQEPSVKQAITPKTIVPSPPITTTSSQTISAKPAIIQHGFNTLDIHEIEERFKTEPSPQLGLYLARYYYDRKNYNEAYNYALQTNSINKDIEESWLIFSKSLIKLGNVEQAKKTLQYYISQSNSNSAKELLYSLEHGDVK